MSLQSQYDELAQSLDATELELKKLREDHHEECMRLEREHEEKVLFLLGQMSKAEVCLLIPKLLQFPCVHLHIFHYFKCHTPIYIFFHLMPPSSLCCPSLSVWSLSKYQKYVQWQYRSQWGEVWGYYGHCLTGCWGKALQPLLLLIEKVAQSIPVFM